MKWYFLFLPCLLWNVAFAGDIQEAQVPAAVKAYVTEHYPEASKIKWDFEKDDNLFEVEFKINGLEYKLELTPAGVLHASKEDIEVAALPENVTTYIQKNYPDYKILGANKKVKGKVVKFDVGIKGKNSYGNIRHHNLYFDGQGNLIK